MAADVTEGRIPAAVRAAALIRIAEEQGGFGMVLAKGDATGGAILLIVQQRGAESRLYERVLRGNDAYSWNETAAGEVAIAERIAKQRRFDPDLWALELDVPDSQRFIATVGTLD